MKQKEELKEHQYFLRSVDRLLNSEEIQHIFRRYELVIRCLYEHFLEYSDAKIQDSRGQKLLNQNGFYQFFANFQMQIVIKQQHVLPMYLGLIKDKVGNERGITLKQFHYCLLRLAIMANPIWDIIWANFHPEEAEQEAHEKEELEKQKEEAKK